MLTFTSGFSLTPGSGKAYEAVRNMRSTCTPSVGVRTHMMAQLGMRIMIAPSL